MLHHIPYLTPTNTIPSINFVHYHMLLQTFYKGKLLI
jgi:hypothetical protein